MHHVGIVIVNWNGWKDSRVCLDSIVKHIIRAKKSYTVRVLFVDNASTDGSADMARKLFPDIEVIQNKENLGFTGGNNVGMRRALEEKCSLIWLLNNDTVIESSTLDALVATFDDPSIGIVGSKIYFARGHEYHTNRYSTNELGSVLWYAGGRIDWRNMYASHRGVDEVDHGQYDTAEDTEFISGCSMCIRSSVIEKIGMFDEKYYLYMEDLDLCLRAQRAGFRTVYIPGSRVWHNNAGSSASGSALHEYYQTRNRLLIGLQYASLRTKLALFRESLRQLSGGNAVKQKAVSDFYLQRFGRQYEQ